MHGATGACYCRDIDREAQGATPSHPGAHPARRATQGAGRGEAPGNNSTTRERGVAMTLTLGGCGVWALVDAFFINRRIAVKNAAIRATLT